jgi:hypothetical protein
MFTHSKVTGSQPDPNKDGFNISFDLSIDIDSEGNFSENTRKELSKGGDDALTNFQINSLEQEAKFCKLNGGSFLKCTSLIHPEEKYNGNNTCCLFCTCQTSLNNEVVHTVTPVHICANSWYVGF